MVKEIQPCFFSESDVETDILAKVEKSGKPRQKKIKRKRQKKPIPVYECEQDSCLSGPLRELNNLLNYLENNFKAGSLWAVFTHIWNISSADNMMLCLDRRAGDLRQKLGVEDGGIIHLQGIGMSISNVPKNYLVIRNNQFKALSINALASSSALTASALGKIDTVFSVYLEENIMASNVYYFVPKQARVVSCGSLDSPKYSLLLPGMVFGCDMCNLWPVGVTIDHLS